MMNRIEKPIKDLFSDYNAVMASYVKNYSTLMGLLSREWVHNELPTIIELSYLDDELFGRVRTLNIDIVHNVDPEYSLLKLEGTAAVKWDLYHRTCSFSISAYTRSTEELRENIEKLLDRIASQSLLDVKEMNDMPREGMTMMENAVHVIQAKSSLHMAIIDIIDNRLEEILSIIPVRIPQP